jgi:hypothetical protein
VKRSWFLVVAVPLLVALVSGRPWWVLAPSVALALLLLALNRRGVRMRFHLEALRWPAILAIALPVALNEVVAELLAHATGLRPRTLDLPVGQLLLVVLLTVLHSTSVASEFSTGTASTWLTQPRSLRWLVAERWLASVVLALTAVATVVAFEPEALESSLFAAMMGAAIGGFALVIALLLKDPFAALVTSLICLGALLAGVTWLSHDHEVAPMLLVAPTSIGLVVFAIVRARELIWRPLPTLAVRPGRAIGRTTPLKALLRKEVRLHVLPGAAMLASALACALANRLDRPMVAAFGGSVVALLAGIGAISEERHHHTMSNDVAVLPHRFVWRVKLGVMASVAALGGFVLPVVEGNLTHDLVEYGLVVSLAMVAGLVGAAVAKDLTRAFAGALGLAVGGVIVWSVGFRVVNRSFTDGPIPSLLGVLVPGLMLVGVGLSVGRRAWLLGGLSRRANVEGWVAFLSAGVVGGVVQRAVAAALSAAGG